MEKMMAIFGLVLAMVISACGGGDTDPMPEPDGQVATSDGLPSTDGANPATDTDPSLPECKVDVSKITTGFEGNSSYIGVYVMGDDYSSEPKAKVEVTFKTYHNTSQTNDLGFFAVEFVMPTPKNSQEFPKSVTLTISKKTCRTKTIELTVRRY
ncbi:MAG: hypothetical protein WC520_04565 [Candidatus Paceibacterota bacterium]